jgi:hypothetical protein
MIRWISHLGLILFAPNYEEPLFRVDRNSREYWMGLKEDIETEVKRIFRERLDSRDGTAVP